MPLSGSNKQEHIAWGPLENPVFFSRLLDTVGDGTGTTSMTVNGAGTRLYYKLIVPTAKQLIVGSISIYMQDASAVTGMGASDYAGIGGGLTVGMTAEIIWANGDPDTVLCEQHPIKTNGDWMTYADIAQLTSNTGDDAIRFSIPFIVNGPGMRLGAGDILQFIVQDNLSTLAEHHVQICGTLYDA